MAVRRHVVQAPGGIVDVREDDAGNLSGRLRSGYVETDESKGRPLRVPSKLYVNFIKVITLQNESNRLEAETFKMNDAAWWVEYVDRVVRQDCSERFKLESPLE